MTIGSDVERTEVWTGIEDIISKSIKVISSTKDTFDLCTDSTGPTVTMNVPMIKDAYFDMNQRGVKIRHITEITKDNLADTIEFMKAGEVRHMDGVVGNFVVADGSAYAGAPTIEKDGISKLLVSNVDFFVKQQQYFFDLLWAKSIPATERILEIQEGIKPANIVVMREIRASLALAFEIMNATKKEFAVLFATPRTFIIAMSTGVAKLYSEMIAKGVKIRILVPRSSADDGLNDIISDLKKTAPLVDLRLSDGDLNTRISLMVSDRKEFIAWELKDDSKDDPYEAGGVATYSDSQALASSYATIFDNLWNVVDIADNLVQANLKLHESQRAMKEFINIAAHELRTPIQPILGLAEILADKNSKKAIENERADSQLLRVIVRNAKRLQDLSDKILDVTKIESNSLSLKKEKIEINKLLAQVLEDAKTSLANSNNVNIHCEYFSQPIVVNGDPTRIAQVISNLVDNALKFTQSGSVRLMVQLDGVDKVIVKVHDTGMGIDPLVLPRIFEKFVSKSERGTGLGLFICKSIIEAHGGKIWAENNKDGIGATVAFSLPITH